MARAALGFRDFQGRRRSRRAGRISRNSAPSARRCCRASPASRCCGTNSSKPWWEWPEQWRQPDDARCAAPARGRGRRRDRIRRIRAMDRRPAAAGLPGSRARARHEGRSLSRRRGRRAVRRLRRLERAGGDLAPSRGRRAAGPAQHRGPELGPCRLQRRRPGDAVVRAVSARCCAPRCATPARSGSITCWA